MACVGDRAPRGGLDPAAGRTDLHVAVAGELLAERVAGGAAGRLDAPQ